MIGIDIVKISRVKKVYDKFTDKFLKRIFNEDEILYLKERPNFYESLAGYFAAKEAISKANETGIDGISFKDIKLSFDPYVARIKENIFSYSVSHEREYAVANAIKIGEIPNYDKKFRGFLKRDENSHKGDFGKVFVIAGSENMPGALILSLMASLRTGSGLSYFHTDEKIKYIVLNNCYEAIYEENISSIEKMDAVLIGPGLGVDVKNFNIIKNALSYNKKTVIDADGLNIISKRLHELDLRNAVLTPHEMEFSRISGLSLKEISKDRENVAKEFANKYNTTLLLKGHETIVTDGKRVYKNNIGGAELATAGSGDVLSGIIVSLLGRGISLYESASFGAMIHGLAGHFAKETLGENSVLARDIVNNISRALVEVDKVF